MIYTVTLNPSLDRVIWVDELKTDDSVRIINEKHYAGGKGIDASRVIKALGGDTTASGFLGSFNGMELEGLLINEGVHCDFVKIAAETRSNVIVFTNKSNEHISFNSSGPEITPYDLALLFNKIKTLSSKPDFVLLSGSLPKNVNENVYAQLIHLLKCQGIKVALDSDNQPLKEGVKEKPFMIKPNSHEFTRLVGRVCQSDAEILQAGQTFIKAGIEVIMVSMGAKGLLVFNKYEAYRLTPPRIEVKSTIGSGDSTLAAFVHGLKIGKNIADAAIMGTAAGAATAMSPGVELVNFNDYMNLLPQVVCEPVSLEEISHANDGINDLMLQHAPL
ncbi:MAG: 1-phosphofructokinase [Candidatus Caenarcaniphilales bacterium]|nr:1-phosphofructokinase [Candidatus Caenarcaniphilales bacterium]